MRQFKHIGVGIVVVGLAGCAGMSQNECELADWQAVGYEDGARGRVSDTFGNYRRNCAKHGVAPDFQAYQAGRAAGLTEYCQPARGYREGHRGAEYQGVCPADLEGAFLASYFEGRTLYELEQGVRTTIRQIEYRKARIEDIELELTETMAAVLAEGAPGEERARLLVETKHLAEERMTLEQEIDDLEDELGHQREQLAAYESRLVTQR